MMNNDRLERDSEQASLLQQLLDRPIGRRWLLKAGLGSAAALAAAIYRPGRPRQMPWRSPRLAAASYPVSRRAPRCSSRWAHHPLRCPI